MFSKLVNLGKKISDFQITKALTGGEEALDDTYGINVQFEESEEEDDEDMYGEVKEDDDDEDIDGEEAKDSSAIQAQNVSTLKSDCISIFLFFYPSGLLKFILWFVVDGVWQ